MNDARLIAVRALIDELIAEELTETPKPKPPSFAKHMQSDASDPSLASAKQSKMLFAVSQANGLSADELNAVLDKFGVTSGWTGDVPAPLVNDVKKAIEAYANSKVNNNEHA